MLLRFLDIAREKCAWAVQGGKVLLCKGQSAVHRLRCNSKHGFINFNATPSASAAETSTVTELIQGGGGGGRGGQSREGGRQGAGGEGKEKRGQKPEKGAKTAGKGGGGS